MSDLDSDLDSSLRRSLSLGLEVLERASRRRVDWTRLRTTTQNLDPTESRERPDRPQQSSGVELKAAFTSISEFMSRTSLLCQRYHDVCPSLSDSEQTHVYRFHCSSDDTTPHQCEDFYIEVSPGTYSVTASVPPSPRQQSRTVTLGDGQSVRLTFDL